MKKILIVAAHPDDEILGCGGTIAKLIDSGCEAYSLVLSQGVDSRGENETEKIELRGQMLRANEVLGVKEVINLAFPDNVFDSVPLLNIIKEIEKIKSELQPDTIFTHFRNDLNIDHQITYKALLTATRPMEWECVKRVLSFSTLSATEWRFPHTFSPNYFVNIEGFLDKKISAMSEYKNELREYPHPRSLKSLRLEAELMGSKVGCRSAEAFEIVRWID